MKQFTIEIVHADSTTTTEVFSANSLNEAIVLAENKFPLADGLIF